MPSVAKGLGWTALAAAINALLQLAVLAVLARQLTPVMFGLVASAALSTRLLACFAHWGMAQTLVQRAELMPGHLSAALALAGGASLLLGAALALAAPWLAPLLAQPADAPAWVPVLQVFALMLPLSSLAVLPLALLRRSARHGAASAVEVTSYAIGFGAVGIVAAAAGWGVWALVAASLSQQVLLLVLAASLARYPMAWPVPRAAWREVMAQGSGYSLIGFLEVLWLIAEGLLIGRLWGQAALGLVNRAQALAQLPVELAVNAGAKVLFPALAARQHDRVRLVEAFWLLLLINGFVSVCLGAGIAAAAPDLVAALLGPQWLAATPLVALMAWGAPASFIYMACGLTLDGMAALRPKLQLQAVLLVIKGLALAWALGQGLWVLVAVIVLAEWLRALAGLRLLRRLLVLPARPLMFLLLALTGLGAAMFTAVWAARTGLASAAVALPWRLGAELAVAAAVAAAAAALGLARSAGFTPLLAIRQQVLLRWRGAS